MMSAMPSRTMRWSSTQRTRIGGGVPYRGRQAVPDLACQRHRGLDRRPAAGARRDGERAVQFLGPFPHGREPIVMVAGGVGAAAVEATPVVRHPQHDVLGAEDEVEMDPARGRMADGVGDGFLSDAEDLVVYLGRPRRVLAETDDVNRIAAIADGLPGEEPERRARSVVSSTGDRKSQIDWRASLMYASTWRRTRVS